MSLMKYLRHMILNFKKVDFIDIVLSWHSCSTKKKISVVIEDQECIPNDDREKVGHHHLTNQPSIH